MHTEPTLLEQCRSQMTDAQLWAHQRAGELPLDCGNCNQGACLTRQACELPIDDGSDMHDFGAAIFAASCIVAVCAIVGMWLADNWHALVAIALAH